MKKFLLFMFTLCSLGASAVMTVTINAPSGTLNSCSTYSYGYSSTGLGSNIIDSYAWSVTNGTIVGSSTGTSVNVIWNSVTAGTITFVLNYHDGLFYDFATDTKNVTINGSPNLSPPSISGASGSNPNFVPINATSVTFTVPAIPNVTSYSWTYPSCFSATSATTTIPQITFSTTGTCAGNVCVKGLNTACGTYSATTCIAVTRIPVLGAISGPNTSCGTSTSTYSVSTISGIARYVWTVPAGWYVNGTLSPTGVVSIAAPFGSTIDVTPPSGGLGNQTISVYGIVTGVGNTNTQSYLVSFGSPAQPVLAATNVSTMCRDANALHWNATCTSPGVTSWTWSFVPTGGGGTSTGLTVTDMGAGACMINGNHVGNYGVSCIANNACGSSLPAGHSCDVIFDGSCPRILLENTTLPTPVLDNQISVFPNPANQNLTINISSSEASSYTIVLYDILGKQVYKNIKAAEAGENQASVDISNLKNGIYFLNVDNGLNINKEKIIVNH